MDPLDLGQSLNFQSSVANDAPIPIKRGRKRKRKSFGLGDKDYNIPPLPFPGDTDDPQPAEDAPSSVHRPSPVSSGERELPGPEAMAMAKGFAELYGAWLVMLCGKIRQAGGWTPPPEVLHMVQKLAEQAAVAYLPAGATSDRAALAVTVATPLSLIAYEKHLQKTYQERVHGSAESAGIGDSSNQTAENRPSNETASAPVLPFNGAVHGEVPQRKDITF